MKWLRYEADDSARYGVLDGDAIKEVAGTPFDEYKFTGRAHALKAVRLLVPCQPSTFYAAGVNYETHIRSTSAALGKPFVMPRPIDIVGYRAINALSAYGEPIVIPSDSSGKVQYEGELVAVIGKKTRKVSEVDALSHVLGYTIGNDVSERSWQKIDRTFIRSKNCDTFKPMGPWIETDVDLGRLQTVVRLNGKEVSRFATNKMICGVAKAISTISRYVTLYPGDVLWMGTDDPTLDMVAGDSVEIEITGIGVLRNPVVNEARD